MTAGRVVAPAGPPAWRIFRSRVGTHVLVLEGTQILDVDDDAAATLDAAALERHLVHGAHLGLDAVPSVAPQSVSLNLTSACNLGCDYCYADGGRFGGAQSGAMSTDTAEEAVDALLARCDRRALATVGFLGGEPFLRRGLLHHVVRYAERRAGALGQPIGFSVTTNATVLEPDDIELVRSHRFAVTISIDGGRAVHNRRRITLAGQGSWDEVVTRVRPLLDSPGRAGVTARATVTRDDLDLVGRYGALSSQGFSSIGFSPVRMGAGALTDGDWADWQAALVDLGERALASILEGGETAFDNLTTALCRLHAGFASPYPCGAGGGYFSVSTDGAWFACHRAVGDPEYDLGDEDGVVAPGRQRRFLAERHVHAIEPCRSCWARYLCSGGCHQEAATRTAASCDSIRGWLDFCLDAYCAVSSARPGWFRPQPTDTGGR